MPLSDFGYVTEVASSLLDSGDLGPSELGVQLRLSTAYHPPQTDGRTGRVTRILEQYLSVFTSLNQDDWSTIFG